MYCDGCGSPLNPSGQFCSSCGKRWAPATGYVNSQRSMRRYSEYRVSRNIGALTTLWLIYGILRMLAVAALYSFGRMVFPMFFWQHHWGWEGFLPFAFFTSGAFVAAFAGSCLLLAWGLSERESWARSLAIVLSVLVLLRFPVSPLGAALGIYTLWVMLPDPSRREYDQLVHA